MMFPVLLRRGFWLALLLLLAACASPSGLTPAPSPTDDNPLQMQPRQLLIPAGGDNLVTVHNSGDGVVAWRLRSEAPWLELSQSQGYLAPGEHRTIRLRAASTARANQAQLYLDDISHNLIQQGVARVALEVSAAGCIAESSLAPASPALTTPPNTVLTELPELPYVPHQLLVRFEEDAPAELRAGIDIDGYHLHPLRNTPTTRGAVLMQVNPPPAVSSDMEALAAALAARPGVRFAEPNYYLFPQYMTTQSTPATSEPRYPEQWYLKDFGLEQAWTIESGSPAITLAILDSSMDTRHPDLRLLKGCDIYDNDEDVTPQAPLTSRNTHGTHVTGIAAAVGNNGIGISGVAPQGVRVLPVKVFDDSGRLTSIAVVARAIRWAAGIPVEGLHPNPYPAQVLNLSLGGPIGVSAELNEAIAEAHAQGALIFVAAGNGKQDSSLYSPANAPHAIAVGSVDGTRQRSCFSNYNRTLGERSVELVAPGGASGGFSADCDPSDYEGTTILSTLPEAEWGYQLGTSMATPFVSGAAALVWSHDPFASAETIKAKLFNSTYRSMPGYNPSEYGHGIVCVDRALGADTLCGQPINN